MEAVCSPCASHETGSVASDGEGVDYHQDELVSKFTSSVRLRICCPSCDVYTICLVEQVAEVDIAGMPANVDVDLNAECGESGTAQFVELPPSRLVMLRAVYVLLTIVSDWIRVHVSVFGLVGLILMKWKCMKPLDHCV